MSRLADKAIVNGVGATYLLMHTSQLVSDLVNQTDAKLQRQSAALCTTRVLGSVLYATDVQACKNSPRAKELLIRALRQLSVRHAALRIAPLMRVSEAASSPQLAIARRFTGAQNVIWAVCSCSAEIAGSSRWRTRWLAFCYCAFPRKFQGWCLRAGSQITTKLSEQDKCL